MSDGVAGAGGPLAVARAGRQIGQDHGQDPVQAVAQLRALERRGMQQRLTRRDSHPPQGDSLDAEGQ
jgi:hypothetical protein